MARNTPDKETVELIVTLLTAQISNLGYPVGCGQAPHPDMLQRVAEFCVTICEVERLTRERDEAQTTETDDEVRAHIAWLRVFVADMSEANWRDMRLRLERQIERLVDTLYPRDRP